MITKIMFGNVALVIDAKGPHLLYPCVVYLNPFAIVEEQRRS